MSTDTLPIQSFLRPFTTMDDVARVRRKLAHEAALRFYGVDQEATTAIIRLKESKHG